MATDLERLVVQLEANTRRFEREMARARQTANRELSQIERRAKQTNANLSKSFSFGGVLGGGVGRLAGGVGIAVAANEVRQYADAWTEAGNRIKATEQISGRQARTLSDVNKIASDTRSGISATAELYAKLLTSTKAVAKSEEEVAQATEIVNKAFKAGGAAASEQAAGVLQLSQALGSGVLQGDELRSLRENAPLLAQAIADEFGTTIAGLKQLGEEGALSTDRVFKAILSGAPKINAAFNATKATVGDGLEQLGNAATEFFGTLSDITGLSGGASSGLAQLAQAIRELAAAMKAGADTSVGRAFIQVLQDYARVMSGLATIQAVKGIASFISAEDTAQLEKANAQLDKFIERVRRAEKAGVVSSEQLRAVESLRDKLKAGTISADEARAAIQSIAATSPDLANLPQIFDPIISKIEELTKAAQEAASAVSGIARDPDDMAAQREVARESRQRSAFLSGRSDEAKRTEDQKALDARTKEVMEAAEKAGVSLTEGAARIQAASEIAAENLTKSGAASVTGAAELIKKFEGFRATPYFDVNAFRAGFGSDTVTLADGSIQKVMQGITVSLADANRDLERRIADFQKTIEGQIGVNTFRGMNENQQAALTSIAYNYGSLPQRIVEAIKTGNVETITTAIRGLGSDNGGINQRRRNEEADVFLSGAPEALQQDVNLRREQQAIIQQTMAAIQQQNAAIAQETSLIGASNAEKERQRLIMETLNELQRQGIEITPELRAQVEQEAAARFAAVSAYDAQAEAADRLREKQEELAAVQQEIAGAFQSALKGFISDLVHGKDATEALADAVARLADRLLDIALNQIFSSLFGGLGGGLGFFGFAKGGIAAYGKPRPLSQFAGGGVSNTAAIFGEAGPEAAVPLPDGRRIPVDLRLPKLPSASDKMRAAEVDARTTVINAIDAEDMLNVALSGPRGPKLILNVIKAQPAAFRGALQGGPVQA